MVFAKIKLVNLLITGIPPRSAADPDTNLRTRRPAPALQRTPATSRFQPNSPRGKEIAMKYTAPLLAAMMFAFSISATAATPPHEEVQNCLDMAEKQINVRGEPMALLSAERYTLGDGRHMLTLGTRFDNGALSMNPRLYCTVERNGSVSMLQSIPRLPRQSAVAVAAN